MFIYIFNYVVILFYVVISWDEILIFVSFQDERDELQLLWVSPNKAK